MKVLMTAGRFPYPPDSGGSLRVYHLLRLLAPRHTVHLIAAHSAPVSPDQHAALAALGVRGEAAPVAPRSRTVRLRDLMTSPAPDMALRLASPAFCNAVAQALASQDYDLIHVAGLEAAEPVRLALADTRAAKPPVVLDAFNAEYLLQRRAWEVDRTQPRRWPQAIYSLVQWRKLARYEATVCRLSRAVLAMSEDDRAALLPLCERAPVTVAPHGVDTAYYAPAPLARSAVPTALFIGTLDFRPNVDAAVWCAQEVWPLVRRAIADARLLLVGRSPAPAVRALAGSGVEITGAVPDDLPFFQQAQVFVLPMRYGGGVRLKLLQALSVGLPIVTTTMGAEGVAIVDGQHALIADSPRAFAEAVVRVLRDGGLARRLGIEGRQFVQDRYRWETTAQTVERVWEAVAGSPSPRPSAAAAGEGAG